MQSSRFFTFLLGTAAVSLALASTAHAEVLIDQQQLTGQGKTIAQQQFYDDVRARPSPFGNAPINANLPTEPMVIGDASASSSHLPTAPKPIMLKPLPKWGLAAPAQPISAGGRTAILLKPPGSEKLINQLASQSPVRKPQAVKTADNTLMRLRPPAPIPAMQVAQSSLAPQTLKDPSAPQPNTQMAMNAAPVAAAVPVSQMGELRAEDVVALDMNALQGASPAAAVKAAAPAAPLPAASPKPEPVVAPRSAPEEDQDSDVLPEVPKFMPPLDGAPAQTSELKSAPAQTANAEPRFMSPLTEGLPVDEDRDTKVAMAAPAAPLREPKRETPQIDTSKQVETLEPELPKQAAASKNMLPPLPAAPDAPPAPAAEAAGQAEKLLAPEVATAHASPDQAADAVVSSLKEPVEKQNAPVPVPVAEVEPDIEIKKDGSVHWKKDRIAAETIEKNTRIAEASQRTELMAQAEAEKLAAQKLAVQKIAQEEADKEERRLAEIKAKEEAEAKLAAEAEAKRLAEIKAKEDAEAKLIADAKAKAEAEAEAKRLAELKVQEEAERLARQESEKALAAKEAAEANAKLAAEEKAKAIAEVEQKAEAEKLAKAQAEEALRAKEAEIAQARAELEAQKLAAAQAAQAEAAAKVEADAAMKLAIEEKAKLLEATVTKNKMAIANAEPEMIKAEAVPTEPVRRVNIIEPAKIAPKLEVKQASLSSGAMDAGSAAANTEPLTRETLLFSSGLSALPGNSDPVIRELAQQMKNNRDAKMTINAYADGASQTGAAARRLSLQRAMLMRDALNKQGVPVSRVQVRAQTAVVGESNPDRVEVIVQ